MPISYSLPPQLSRDYDVAGKFLSGVQVGASIGEARNRLQAASDQAAMEATQKQQQIAANAVKDAQQLEVQKAYNDQQVQLKQQQLQAVQEKVGQETLKAARQYAAQQQYQKDYQAALDSDPEMTEEDAARSAMFKNLGMFGSGVAGGSAAIRAATQTPSNNALNLQTVGGQKFAVTPKGHAFPIKETNATIPSSVLTRATDETGAIIPNTYVKDGRVVRTSKASSSANNEAIKALESNPKYGVFLSMGRDPKVITPEYSALKAKYQALKSGAAPEAQPTQSASSAQFRYNPDTGKIEPVTTTPDESDTEE